MFLILKGHAKQNLCIYKTSIPARYKGTKTSFLHKPLSRKTIQIAIKTSAKMRLVCSRTMVNKSMATTEFKP